MEKLIITCALTGAEVTKQDNPNLPISPEEITQAALEARQAGASIVHLHARLQDGTPTQDKDIYQEIMKNIRATGNDIILQVSTGGSVNMTAEERIQPLLASDPDTFLMPEMATLTMGTVNFGEEVFLNSPYMIEEFANIMKRYGVLPELEIFDVGMIKTAIDLIKKGVVPEGVPFDFVMGVRGGIPGTPQDLMYLMSSLPKNAHWSVAGIGRAQLPLATMAMVMGGNVRVGFEDNLFYQKGILAKSNGQLVERITRIAKELGREVASPSEAREMLGIPAKK